MVRYNSRCTIPFSAGDRIGIYFRQSNACRYEMQDHLGNVRAVLVKTNSGSTDYVVFRDYYPFGMEIAGRNYTDADGYRYGYQGKYAEKDPETGWNAFELRMYDSRVGRWLNVDPAGQYYSPYVGMGNDPVNKVDPDGGTDSESGAWWYRFTHPSWWGASIRQSEKYGDYFLQKGTDNGVKVTFGGQRYNNTGYMPSGFDYGHWANFQRSVISAYTPSTSDVLQSGYQFTMNSGGLVGAAATTVNSVYVGLATLGTPGRSDKAQIDDLSGNATSFDDRFMGG